MKKVCHLHTKHQVLQQFKPALYEKMMRASKTKSPHPVDFITNSLHVLLSLWSVQFFSSGVLVCMYEWPLQSLPLHAYCNYCCMINNSSDSRSLAGCPLLLRGCYHACALVCMCEACAERVQGSHVSGLVHWIPAKQQLTIQASLSELASSLCTSMAESFPLHRDLSCTLTSLWQKFDHDDITYWVFFFSS